MRNRRVLVVDDDPETLGFLSLHLGAAGFEVQAVDSAQAAFQTIEATHPGVIVSDVRMQGMGGHELCRLVRGLGHDEIPFIFYSAAGSCLERLAGLRAGADDYLVKPASPQALVDAVKRHLQWAREIKTLKLRLARGRRATLRGDLGELDMVDLFKLLDFYGLDEMCLHLEAPDGTRGQVYVANKAVVHASVGTASGEEALERMLAWRRGVFRIERSACPAPPSMRLPTRDCIRIVAETQPACGAAGPRRA